MRYPIYLVFVATLLVACSGIRQLHLNDLPADQPTVVLPAANKTTHGNPDSGWQYMVYGDFIGSGIPFDFLKNRLTQPDTVLRRTGINQNIPHEYNAFAAPNGVAVMAGNCFTCHAGRLEGKVVFGLGNVQGDFTQNEGTQARVLALLLRKEFGKNSDQWRAFEGYYRYIKALSPNIRTETAGVNPAFRLEEACTNYRNPTDLTYQPKPNFNTIGFTVVADVPPLWHVKKKNALYYNGMGRGAFTKLLMQASVLGIPDSSYARQVHTRFDDVLAWILSLQPPKYPYPIEAAQATRGKAIFENSCAKCHGTYDNAPTYPNKLIPLAVVGTDPHYARYFTTASGLATWYNQSWFARSAPASVLAPNDGYVAPPLDGIWATAPFLHNGSVPDLVSLLHSPSRPTKWTRTDKYNFEKVGWQYTPTSKNGYNTTLRGYGNGGHTFGDHLTEGERADLIAYLKTL